MGTQTNRRASDKRERILAAAVKVFAQNGYYTAKVSQVAREAGVADGTIYLYFKNKDDLLISAFEDRMTWLNNRLRSELEQLEGDILSRINRCLELHLALALEERELAEFITVELRQSSKFIKEYKNQKFAEYLGILDEVLRQGQVEGVIRRDIDIHGVSRAIFGACDEVLLSLVLRKEVTQSLIDARTRELSMLFIGGLRATTEHI
jgi:TetR/AcrR family fatty acid metabolism transcriptional regulator